MLATVREERTDGVCGTALALALALVHVELHAWLGLAWLGLAWLGLAWLGIMCARLPQCSAARCVPGERRERLLEATDRRAVQESLQLYDCFV